MYIPDDIAYLYLEEVPPVHKEVKDFLDLSSLSGSNVSVSDRKKGNYEGILLYDLFNNEYSLETSEGIIRLKVRDLEKVTEKEFLN